ncbi:MAG: hypothetical protein RMJ44_11695 [Cytophagales bacterium]|nr:hypothetical protein [Bernardetiaceae bacterium]MDW8211738.1 hypothetical protein [Cytophagales bacterium]
MKNWLLLASLASALLFVGCKSELTEEEIDRKVRKKLFVLGGSPVKEVKLTKEPQKHLYFADAIMENGFPIQAMVFIKDDTIELKETLNSSILRRLTKELWDTCISLKFRPADTTVSKIENEFEGEATFRSGTRIKVFAHEQLGWRPANDSTTLAYLTKRQIERDIYGFRDTIDVFVLQRTATDTLYTGKFQTRKGDKKSFSVTWNQTGFQWKLN